MILAPTFESLKAKIEALPEPERSIRRSFYSDYEWANSWELNAWPHQIPPVGNDWTAWVIVGGPGTGKTYAGQHWVTDKILNAPPGSTILALFHYHHMVELVSEAVYLDLVASTHVHAKEVRAVRFQLPKAVELQTLANNNRILFAVASNVDSYISKDVRYLWADEVVSAPDIMVKFPFTDKFVFTEPTKLPDEARLSRAGNPRVV